MSQTLEAKHLKGFRDFLPRIARVKADIISKIRSTAYSCGFLPMETPCMEYIESLLGEGGETEKEIYRLQDHGGRNLGLRFDLTMPFSRYVAENRGELSFPFKRLEIGEVWRGEKPQKGRQRQFCQGDLDIIGVDSLGADVEILYSLSLILSRILVDEPLTMYLGNRVILSGLIRGCFKEALNSQFKDNSSEFETRVLIILDKLQKIGKENVVEMLAEYSSSKDASIRLLDLVDTDSTQALERAEEFFKLEFQGEELESCLNEVQRLKEIYRIISSLGIGSIKYKVDLSIARGLGYYTGIVFETCIDRLKKFGSISSGGRYNNLVQRFLKDNLQGVGGSVGVDRIVQAMEELNLIPETSDIDVYIALISENERSFGMELASKLRNLGVRVDICLSKTKIANQFRDASRKKASYTVTIGESEVKEGKYNLKNMTTSEELKLAPGEIVDLISRECGKN